MPCQNLQHRLLSATYILVGTRYRVAVGGSLCAGETLGLKPSHRNGTPQLSNEIYSLVVLLLKIRGKGESTV